MYMRDKWVFIRVANKLLCSLLLLSILFALYHFRFTVGYLIYDLFGEVDCLVISIWKNLLNFSSKCLVCSCKEN